MPNVESPLIGSRTCKRPMRVPIVLMLILFSNFVLAQNSIAFREIKTEQDWEQAMEAARESDKMIFADAYATWCGYCKQLDKEVYTNTDVIEYFNREFINVKFDAEKDYGLILNFKLGINSFPTLFFLTPEQEVFQKIEGFIPAPTLLAYGEQTLNDHAKLPVLQEKYKTNTASHDEQLELIGILERKDREQAIEVARLYISSLEKEDYLNNVQNIWLVSRFQNQLDSNPYLFMTSHKEEIVDSHGLEEYEDYFKAIYNDNLALSVKYGNEELLHRLIKEVLPEFLPQFEIPEAAFITKKIYYRERKDNDKYQFAVKTYLNNQVTDDSRVDFLFNNALEIIEGEDDEGMMQFATNLLTQAVALEPSHFESTSLLGYSKALLGEFDEGIKHLEKAKTLAKDEEQKSMANGLLEAVKAMKGS